MPPSARLLHREAAPTAKDAGGLGAALQTLSIYGAAGIVSFGWALSRLLAFDCARYAPLWFFSALFIYNLDRLKMDPADLINMPARSRSAAVFRNVSGVLVVISVVALVSIPMLEHDWLMLFLTVGGAFFCVNYSVPIFGFRFKDVPFLKSFFAPILVTVAFIVPPMLEQPRGGLRACYAMTAAWTLCVTLFNMILCDLRDIRGDSTTGIRSLPVAIGTQRTVLALGALLFLSVLLSIGVLFECSRTAAVHWGLLSVVMPAYLAGLLFAIRRPMPENFYEWWVEGILFVPAIIFFIRA